MGWAEKLPSGRYRAVYRDGAGKKRSAGTFIHKARAGRAANAQEENARKSLQRDPEAFRRPWSEWREEWWPTRDVAASTTRSDKVRLDLHLRPRWDREPIGAITRQDVKAWVSDLRSAGMGSETVKRCVHLFSASMVAAMDAEIITYNPAARLRLSKGAQSQERFLTRAEYDALYEAMPTTEDRLILEVLVHTGIRWGELAGLHRSRVDLKRRVLRVVEVYDETGNVMEPHPKGKRAREVPLTESLVRQLAARPKAVGTCQTDHREGKCRSPLLFSTVGGRPLRNSNWAYRVWAPAVERADIGHVRPHDCRHTYASWLLQRGVPLAEVGRLLGHVSPQTTAKYAHLADTPTAAVLAALDAPRLPHEGPAGGQETA